MPTETTDNEAAWMDTPQRNWLVVIGALHLGLFTLFSVLALALVDSYMVPEIMLGYVFPYGFARRGLGPDAVPFVFFLQAAVVLAFVGSSFLHKGTRTWSKVLAIVLAVLWFLALILINLAAYVH